MKWVYIIIVDFESNTPITLASQNFGKDRWYSSQTWEQSQRFMWGFKMDMFRSWYIADSKGKLHEFMRLWIKCWFALLDKRWLENNIDNALFCREPFCFKEENYHTPLLEVCNIITLMKSFVQFDLNHFGQICEFWKNQFLEGMLLCLNLLRYISSNTHTYIYIWKTKPKGGQKYLKCYGYI